MITAHPDAPEGSVSHLSSYSPEDFQSNCAILCRNGAPLIAFAFDLLRRGIACHVSGKMTDLQTELLKLVDKVSNGNIEGFKDRLRQHRDKEVDRLTRKGKRQQADNFSDKCQALLVIAANSQTTEGVKDNVKKLFASGDGITLSTIHKAKGLEWETVFLLDWSLLPSRYAETSEALQQEKNLQYVAVTRAKLNLRFINSGNWRNGGSR